MADRRPLSAGELCPNACFPRTHRSGRGVSQTTFHSAADIVHTPLSSERNLWERRAMIEITETEVIPASTGPRVHGNSALGRVAAPPEHESTSGVFYFWVDRKRSVERTQIVTTTSSIAGRTVRFVGIVQEVYRRSRQKNIGEESDRFDGRCSEPPPFDS